jgi:hypothetical protein
VFRQRIGQKGWVVQKAWPFDQAPDTAVVATSGVIDKGLPVLRVTRDRDDNGWQFLDGSPVEANNARIVALREIVDMDPSLLKLAALPPGACAERASPAEVWIIGFFH